jgi:hypothetical protein
MLMRRLRWILLVLVLLLVGAVVAAALLVRPKLMDAEAAVDTAWTPLRAPLAARYTALGGVATALTAAGETDRPVTTELTAELERWNALALRGPKHTDATAEARAADQLEALARRARANVAGSARLAADPAITAAFAAFDTAIVPPKDIAAYNRAVRKYQDTREGRLESIVANVLGYEARPELVVGT